jgi:predicted flavoprotein YhiN
MRGTDSGRAAATDRPPSHSGKPRRRRVIVIGGGPAGMMAAGRAAECGARVLLLERTAHPGNKLLITGKSRCNLTNSAELEEFLGAFGANGKFLQGPFHRFFREELLELLGRFGLETKTERGGRIFPASDDAADVLRALGKYMGDAVDVRVSSRVTELAHSAGGLQVSCGGDAVHEADAVVLAAGGASYPSTGSSGDGFRLAESVGHQIVPLRPALVPLRVEEEDLARSMQGLSLRNVRLTAFACPADQIDPTLTPTHDCGRGIPGRRPKAPVIESRFGEMMMTHFGIGGPITLLLSLAAVDALAHGPVSVSVDLKPALSPEQLHQRLQRDFREQGRRSLRRLLKEVLPHSLIEPMLSTAQVPGDKRGHHVTAQERERLVACLKSLRFNVVGPLSLEAAIVTAGGVSLKEVDPRTMQSRLVPGLHFAGEVLDLDADTGGYNLQAAFTTGYIAGESAALPDPKRGRSPRVGGV